MMTTEYQGTMFINGEDVEVKFEFFVTVDGEIVVTNTNGDYQLEQDIEETLRNDQDQYDYMLELVG
jgi:hypothetical protein